MVEKCPKIPIEYISLESDRWQLVKIDFLEVVAVSQTWKEYIIQFQYEDEQRVK